MNAQEWDRRWRIAHRRMEARALRPIPTKFMFRSEDREAGASLLKALHWNRLDVLAWASFHRSQDEDGQNKAESVIGYLGSVRSLYLREMPDLPNEGIVTGIFAVLASEAMRAKAERRVALAIDHGHLREAAPGKYLADTVRRIWPKPTKAELRVSVTNGGRSACEKFLRGTFAADPDRSGQKRKADLKGEALAQFGALSPEGFERIWSEVARDYPAWSKAGARPGPRKSSGNNRRTK